MIWSFLWPFRHSIGEAGNAGFTAGSCAMTIEFAVDELYETGWAPLDTAGCNRDSQGRWLPSLDRVGQEIDRLGATLELEDSDGFGCCTASWDTGQESGRCIAGTRAEAAVHALAQARRAVLQVVSA